MRKQFRGVIKLDSEKILGSGEVRFYHVFALPIPTLQFAVQLVLDVLQYYTRNPQESCKAGEVYTNFCERALLPRLKLKCCVSTSVNLYRLFYQETPLHTREYRAIVSLEH
jgi:hypothetical protein